MFLKNKYLKVIVLFVGFQMFAQQQSQYTQYMYNNFSINPAFTGYRNSLSAVLLHRSQWMGFEGAPTTQTFSIQTPLKDNVSGVGLDFYNDKIGEVNNMAISGNYSYTIETNSFNIAFGVKAGISRVSIDFSKLTLENQSDKSFENINNKIAPQIGSGALIYNEKFYFGLSVPNILQTTYVKANAAQNILKDANERMNFYAMGGYVFDFSDSLAFHPNVVCKIIQGAPAQFDFTGNFVYDKKITFGLGYRHDAAFSALAAVQISESFLIGVSYDYDTTKFSNYNSGSGEFVLRYELFNNLINRRIINPRVF